MTQKANIKQSAVIGVNNILHMTETSFNRREYQRLKKEQTAIDNVLSTQTYGPISLNFIKFPIPEKSTFDTSKKYLHVGGYTKKYTTNIQWTNNNGNGKKFGYKKGHLTTFSVAQMNPNPIRNHLLERVRGESRPSNPLPAFPVKINDAKKADPINKMLVKDDGLDFDLNPSARTFTSKFYDNPHDISYDFDEPFDYVSPSVYTKDTHPIPAYLLYVKPLFLHDLLKKACYSLATREVDQLLYDCYLSQIDATKPNYHAQADNDETIDAEYLSAAEMVNSTLPSLEHESADILCASTPITSSSDEEDKSISSERNRIIRDIPENHLRYLMKYATDPKATGIDSPLYKGYLKQAEGDRFRFLVHYDKSQDSDYEASSEEESDMLTMVKSMFTLPARASAAVDSVNNMFDKQLPKVMDKVKVVADKATVFMDSVTKVINNLMSSLPAIGDTLQYAAIGGHLMNLLYDAYNYKFYSLPVLIFKIGFSFSSIFSIVTAHLFQPVTPQRVTEGYDAASFLELFTNNRLLINVGKTFNSFTQIKNGLNTLDSFIEWVYKYLPDFMRELLEYFYPDPTKFASEYRNFIIHLTAIGDKMDKKLPLTQQEVDEVATKITYYDTFLLTTNGKNKDAYHTYRHARILASKIYTYHEHYSEYMTPRQCPFSIVFQGASRVGKTVLMSHVLQTLQTVDNHKGPLSYTRQAGTDHWDGYTSDTYGVIYDDWLQNTDYADVAEYFALVTKQHFIVPMASLSDPIVGKKGTLCLSPIIIAATNMRNQNAVSTKINCPEALFSRITFRVDVTRTRENGVETPYDSSGNFAHLRFSIVKNDVGGPLTNYRDMMLQLVRTRNAHMKTQSTDRKSVV